MSQCLSAIFFLILSMFMAAPADALTIKNIRGGVNPDKIRLVLELDQTVDFKVTLADNPWRLLIDLPDASLDDRAVLELSKLGITDMRQEPVTGLDRFVFALRDPVKIVAAFMLPRDGAKPDRLVIDYKHIAEGEYKAATSQTLGTLGEGRASSQPRRANAAPSFGAGSLGVLTHPVARDGTPLPIRPSLANADEGLPVPRDKPSLDGGPPPDPDRKYVVVIDAGHGGKDPGAIGVGRVQEKNITLAAAKELARQLQDTGRYQAILTRATDRFILLPDRVRFARGAQADLFISLHADMAGSGHDVNGLSIYTLSDQASDAQTEKLAARENKVDLLAGVDLSHQEQDVANILIDLAMRENMNQSRFFAGNVIRAMMGANVELLPRPQRYAGFAVLKAADIPSVLIEMGFLSNSEETRRLQDETHRRRLMEGLRHGIDAYFDHLEINQRL